MQALDYIVRSGRALYAGISSYNATQTQEAIDILNSLGTPLLVHQPRYNLLDRWIEDGLTDVLDKAGVGAVVFSPLAQGLLSNKYLQGIPEGSRAARSEQIYLNTEDIAPATLDKIRALQPIAEARRQSLAQMAIAWVLSHPTVTSAIIGASRVEQIEDSVQALQNLTFTDEERQTLASIVG